MPVPPTVAERQGYNFTGWKPEIVAVMEAATYTAQYKEASEVVYFIVTFLDWDGTELYSEQVEEGHDAHGPEAEPTRDGYLFTGWSRPITNITQNLTVIAQYEKLSDALDDVRSNGKSARKIIEDDKVYIILPDGRKVSVIGTEVK